MTNVVPHWFQREICGFENYHAMQACCLSDSDMAGSTHLTPHRFNCSVSLFYHHDSIWRHRHCSCGGVHPLTLNNVPSVSEGRKKEASGTPEKGLTQISPEERQQAGQLRTYCCPGFSQGELVRDSRQGCLVLLLLTSQQTHFKFLSYVSYSDQRGCSHICWKKSRRKRMTISQEID